MSLALPTIPRADAPRSGPPPRLPRPAPRGSRPNPPRPEPGPGAADAGHSRPSRCVPTERSHSIFPNCLTRKPLRSTQGARPGRTDPGSPAFEPPGRGRPNVPGSPGLAPIPRPPVSGSRDREIPRCATRSEPISILRIAFPSLSCGHCLGRAIGAPTRSRPSTPLLPTGLAHLGRPPDVCPAGAGGDGAGAPRGANPFRISECFFISRVTPKPRGAPSAHRSRSERPRGPVGVGRRRACPDLLAPRPGRCRCRGRAAEWASPGDKAMPPIDPIVESPAEASP